LDFMKIVFLLPSRKLQAKSNRCRQQIWIRTSSFLYRAKRIAQRFSLIRQTLHPAKCPKRLHNSNCHWKNTSSKLKQMLSQGRLIKLTLTSLPWCRL
jgi:hypothetical protein